SHGLQVYLAGLPPGRPAHFAPGVPALHVDSPWSFVTLVQGEGFWRNVRLPAGTRYVLSATWSEAHAPGLVTRRPMTECRPEEVVAECLAQTGFPAGGHVVGWHVDDALGFFDET